VLLAPLLYDQFLLLSEKIPDYAAVIKGTWLPSLLRFAEHISPDAVSRIQEAVGNVSGVIFQYIGTMLANILKSGLAILNILSLIFITPLITFYVLRDWDRIIAKVDGWLPRRHQKVIREQMHHIDRTLSGYIRGQTNVCLLMGLFYGIGLSLVRLDFGLVIGFTTGILTFIPYAGFAMGFVAGILVAFFQFGLSVEFGAVLGVFMVGQVLESNFITPKLVGDQVGLHPAWLVFGMLAGAAIFGFVGVLLAVPVTAIIGVLTRFFLERYLHSALYLDKDNNAATSCE
jgi:predicted PurR-regulated permease PerM